MNHDINETVKEIKRSFRLLMNGVASQSMREKGTSYSVNWGCSLGDLSQMAKQYGKNYHLAIALWKENIRECKILATLIMPPEQLDADIVDIWIADIHTQDLAEIASFNLFQYLPYASVLAYQWMATDDKIKQICAYQVLSRLFMRGVVPNERGINEFLDQCSVALQHEDVGVRHAAMNCIVRFCALGDEYHQIATKALQMEI